jgi:hypothetical protein
MMITADDVRAAARPVPAAPAAPAAPRLTDTEIQRLLRVLNQHGSDHTAGEVGDHAAAPSYRTEDA